MKFAASNAATETLLKNREMTTNFGNAFRKDRLEAIYGGFTKAQKIEKKLKIILAIDFLYLFHIFMCFSCFFTSVLLYCVISGCTLLLWFRFMVIFWFIHLFTSFTHTRLTRADRDSNSGPSARLSSTLTTRPICNVLVVALKPNHFMLKLVLNKPR